MGEYSTATRLFTWMVHTFDNRNASLSEGGALAVVVPGFLETPHQAEDNTDLPRLMRQSEARLRLARPPSPGTAARRTRGVLVVGATPRLWPLMHHGAGAGYLCLYSSFSPASGGRSHHRDPWREGHRAPLRVHGG